MMELRKQLTVWFLYIFQLLGSSHSIISIHVNNPVAIILAKKFNLSKIKKHINLKYHWTSEKSESGKISISYMPTVQMQEDELTKSLD